MSSNLTASASRQTASVDGPDRVCLFGFKPSDRHPIHDFLAHGARDHGRREFRQAVRLILRAIAHSEKLAPIMVMKGDILLAIRYQSSWFTKDVDFSTQQKVQAVDLPAFIAQMEQAKVLSAATL